MTIATFNFLELHKGIWSLQLLPFIIPCPWVHRALCYKKKNTKKNSMLLYSIQVIKEDFRRLKTIFSLTDRRSHLTAAALLKPAFNNGSRTNKTQQNIRRIGMEGGGRRGGKEERRKKNRLQAFPEAVSQLNVSWSFLKRGQGLLEHKTQNHSVPGRDREGGSSQQEADRETQKRD